VLSWKNRCGMTGLVTYLETSLVNTLAKVCFGGDLLGTSSLLVEEALVQVSSSFEFVSSRFEFLSWSSLALVELSIGQSGSCPPLAQRKSHTYMYHLA
jgi:hypothetical protein